MVTRLQRGLFPQNIVARLEDFRLLEIRARHSFLPNDAFEKPATFAVDLRSEGMVSRHHAIE